MAVNRSRCSTTAAPWLHLIAICAGCAQMQQTTNQPEGNAMTAPTSEAAWGEPTGGWRLSLSLPQATYAPDAPIVATIRFQNVSAREQQLGGNGRDFDHDFVCTLGDGAPVALTSYGRLMIENRGLGKSTGGVLPPRGQTEIQVQISRHLDLSLPGRYRLVASRQVFANEDPQAPFVVSNTVEFVRSE